jgi:gluconolactonase
VIIALAALAVGLLGGYLSWGRHLRRVEAQLLAVSEVSRPPTVKALTALLPAAVIDLATRDGVSLVNGQWRHSDVPVSEASLDASRAGVNFDDSSWAVIDPSALDGRSGKREAWLTWYRINAAIPERLGRVDPTGSTVIFEVVADGYAEIWADGRLSTLHDSDGATRRAIVTRDARPGQRFQLAVLTVKPPRLDPTREAVGLRSATLDFLPAQPKAARGVGAVLRLHPALDTIVTPGGQIDKLADSFQAVEGPVWIPAGYLLFSDFRANVIYRWSPDDGVSVFRTKSGYAAVDIGDFPLPGSNGLALDLEGRLTIAEHGRRRIVRLDRHGAVSTVADRYDGRRLNSPNDLIYKSDGALYFTDPPFGLPARHADPGRELPYSGIFRWTPQGLQLLSADLRGPNGLAFSPDERYLYVTDWDEDEARSSVIRLDVQEDGTLGNRRMLFKLRGDGVKVDRNGTVFVAATGGVWVISPDGVHLGTIALPERPSNLAWGGSDRRELYMTAGTGLYRIRLQTQGAGVPVGALP